MNTFTINDLHKNAPKHILKLEVTSSTENIRSIFYKSEMARRFSNVLTGHMKTRYEQMSRTKKYRKVKELYSKACDNKDKKTKQKLNAELNLLQKQYGLTWDQCRLLHKELYPKYHLDSIFALTIAENVWKGVETLLFGKAKKLGFKKRGDFPSLRAKQKDRCIVIKQDNDTLYFEHDRKLFTILSTDDFQNREISNIIYYLKNSTAINEQALSFYNLTGETPADTFRPCYASFVCKRIRGKDRLYVHITIEGYALPKLDQEGNFKHKQGKGRVGCDVGTQSVAFVSDTVSGLENLAERGSSIKKSERREWLIHRKLDRSRRATNPQNYNEDGTIRKGRKKWYRSRHYKKLLYKLREMKRKNSINRHLAINEQVNKLRTLGNIVITESKNASKLAKRAKKTTVNAKGKFNRKKRFGKSIKNRCPGYFQAQLENKFDVYIEVPESYKASQYDHTADEYIKKKLSQRMYKLTNGTTVQRDWYSAFLMYCINDSYQDIDKQKVNKIFSKKLEEMNQLIEYIRRNHIKVMNSGIRLT
ncbi:MAG: hypothetical protein Q4C49_13580 [Bacillota bacterium]|nr:hypothetical protein [Bacillota bacterium]